MAEFIYRKNNPIPPHAMCDCGYCGPALNEVSGGWKCLCCNPPQKNKKRVDQCSSCGRKHAPAEDHHPLGRRLQKFLGIPKWTIRICLNCHAEISAYLLPTMLIQKLLFASKPMKNIGNTVGGFVFAIIVLYGYYAYESDDPYHARDFRNDAYSTLNELRNTSND